MRRQAVILAGGLGSRLRPFTEVIPKPLLPLGEKSILEVQILRLKKFGFNDIFLATNYKSDYIESFFGTGKGLGVNITVSKEDRPLGTCGPLTLIKERLESPFLIMNGDILTTIDFDKLYNYSLETDSDFTVVTKKIVMPFAFGNVISRDNYIIKIEEKPDITVEIIAGIYMMKLSIFRYIPDNQYFGMDKLIKKMIDNDIPVGRYLMHEFWLDIGQLPDYEKAQDVYEKYFKE